MPGSPSCRSTLLSKTLDTHSFYHRTSLLDAGVAEMMLPPIAFLPAESSHPGRVGCARHAARVEQVSLAGCPKPRLNFVRNTLQYRE